MGGRNPQELKWPIRQRAYPSMPVKRDFKRGIGKPDEDRLAMS
jgi:hypothetical protein